MIDEPVLFYSIVSYMLQVWPRFSMTSVVLGDLLVVAAWYRLSLILCHISVFFQYSASPTGFVLQHSNESYTGCVSLFTTLMKVEKPALNILESNAHLSIHNESFTCMY